MDNYSNVSGMSAGFPLFFITNGDRNNDYDVKLNHDSYEVYVDDELVGTHTFLLHQEDASFISDFLHEQGYNHVPVEVNGDHIIIHADSQQEREHMERIIRVFLENR